MRWHEETSKYTPHDWYYVDDTGLIVATVIQRASGIAVYEGNMEQGRYIDIASAKAAVERKHGPLPSTTTDKG